MHFLILCDQDKGEGKINFKTLDQISIFKARIHVEDLGSVFLWFQNIHLYFTLFGL
jgi:hypothetical protein